MKKPSEGHARPRIKRTLVWILIGVVLIAVGLLAFLKFNFSSDKRDTTSGKAAILSEDVQTLTCRWIRTDAPYVIEIQGVNNDGTMQASYYNPRLINVACAEARKKNGTLEIFVELRDVNYPGSHYTLGYDRENDRLQGVYFQAAIQQNFDVSFVRMQPEK